MAQTRTTRVSNLVNRLLEAVSVISLLLLMVHTVANALLRYAAASPITGTNEFVGYWYLPLAALLGFSLAQRGGSHIEARLVFDRFPMANRIEIQLFGQVLTIALCVGFAYYGWGEALDAWRVGLTGGMSAVVIWPMLFLVPFSFIVLTWQLVLDAVAVVRRRDPDATSHGHRQHDDIAALGD